MIKIRPEDIKIEYAQKLFGQWWYKAILSLPGSRKVASMGRIDKREKPDIIMRMAIKSLTEFLSEENNND